MFIFCEVTFFLLIHTTNYLIIHLSVCSFTCTVAAKKCLHINRKKKRKERVPRRMSIQRRLATLHRRRVVLRVWTASGPRFSPTVLFYVSEQLSTLNEWLNTRSPGGNFLNSIPSLTTCNNSSILQNGWKTIDLTRENTLFNVIIIAIVSNPHIKISRQAIYSLKILLPH